MLGRLVARQIKIAFTDFWHPETEAAIRANPLCQLLQTRFDLVLSDQPDFLLYSTFGRRHLRYDCTRIFYTGENVRPDFGRCDYAFSFDYPVTEKNYRLPLYRLYDDYDRVWDKGSRVPDPAQQRFCNFLYSNARARERIDFLHRLNRYRTVDCGGRLMNNIGGRVENKLEFLTNYKFTIAFENSSHPGYTTEKLLEALVANTIPIYWGNPLVAKDFNPDGFINCHDYSDFDAVVEQVRAIDQDDDAYRRYISAPVFRDGVEPEAVGLENILDRFDHIFDGPRISGVARPGDRTRYLLGGANLRETARRLAKRLRQ
ncbi:MAG: glycosyltransferase [Xanthomonadales bacterium]|nr:glycosyltransferase [Xanthomonadales bacterium]